MTDTERTEYETYMDELSARLAHAASGEDKNDVAVAAASLIAFCLAGKADDVIERDLAKLFAFITDSIARMPAAAIAPVN
jgi:hypothetical protein